MNHQFTFIFSFILLFLSSNGILHNVALLKRKKKKSQSVLSLISLDKAPRFRPSLARRRQYERLAVSLAGAMELFRR